MEEYVYTVLEAQYGVKQAKVSDLGGGFYGRVFLARLAREPYTVVVKLYRHKGICAREREQLDALRLYAPLKVPAIYGEHRADAAAPFDALLMEYIEGRNAGTTDVPENRRAAIAEQVVDNLISIHQCVHKEGFGELNSDTYEPDWRDFYKGIAGETAGKAEALYRKGWISDDCIGVVRTALEHFDAVFYRPVPAASLVHGDYNMWNILLNESKTDAIALIDPYQCRYADPEFDLYQLNSANGPEYGLFERYRAKRGLSENWRVKLAFYELFTELMHYSDSGVKPIAEKLERETDALRQEMEPLLHPTGAS